MRKWRTIRSEYPDNPHACNILSRLGMDVNSLDLTPEARKETAREDRGRRFGKNTRRTSTHGHSIRSVM